MSLPEQTTKTMNTTSKVTGTRWWLALDGRPDGPRTIAYITAAVQAGQVTLTTPACPEGGCEWKPLSIWPELAAVSTAQQQSPPSFPSTSLPTAAKAPAVGNDDRLLTNDLLPPMANLICVYTILIVPLFWIFGFVMVFTEDNPFLEGTWFYLAFVLENFVSQVLTLLLTVLLAVGGVRLRALRSSGERCVRLGLWLGFMWIAARCITYLLLFIAGAMADAFEESSETMSAWNLFAMGLGVAALAWDIVCLIWLTRHRDRLPLNPHA